ncbi:MAG: hypothetical protein JJU32_17795 [Phormidium sp. BM_Day4_Bin.17]|nr:hypothetical protein [Phormidium sp. BM_Day4_Bin.17]UCJ11026.1 MAG: hypothetical protein JWS08_14565 [Phormidium sp. PBR-2020]
MQNLLGQSDGKRSFETAQNIEITESLVRFGWSVYQLKNVTGFEVSDIKKNKFPFLLVFSLVLGGLISIGIFGTIGWALLLLAVLPIFYHFTQPRYHGLKILLNSGEEKFFVSSDKYFLLEIISTLYNFFQSGKKDPIQIDMSSRSVNIGGHFKGNMNLGDGNRNPLM